MASEHLDVLIVGAGLSGIGAAVHLQKNCPNKTYALLEGRDALGGTWDLFRYPGIRSDSDMYTLGYAFKPWVNAKAIAGGDDILEYIRGTAREYGVDQRIRYRHRMMRAAWSTADATWTVDVDRGPDLAPLRLTCNFLFMCSGYYNYAEGYTPDFTGIENFKGRVVHPQKWTPDIDYAGKRVVVIGSGATAITLVPSLAQKAAHVTMLQRSPTYVVSRPTQDRIANGLKRVLPAGWAYGLTRWKNVLLGMLFYRLSKKRPDGIKDFILKGVREALGPDYDVAKHFTPNYKPWDQRVCMVTDGDLFTAINQGRASMVTDHIDSFTERGIKLKSGQELEADLIVTATGLKLQLLGGASLSVDGKPIALGKSLNYKGMMFSDVPNLVAVVGYTNASWTLKADLTCEYACRLLNHMQQYGLRQCTARRTDPNMVEQPWVDFNSGYVLRSLQEFPKQGERKPWRLYQNYALDIMSLRFGSLEDDAMEFANPAPASSETRAAA